MSKPGTRSRSIAALGIAGLLLAPSTSAGPWATGKGRYYAKLSFQRLRSTQLAAPDGTVFRIPVFLKHDAYAFAIYGVSERLDVLTNLPLLRSSDLENFGRESGFGDVQAGIQYQFARRGATVFGVRAVVQAPTGDETRAEGILPTGSGTWEGSAVLGVGSSFAGGKLYGFAEAGYQFRGSGLRDGVTYETQLGWNVTPRVILAANLRGVEPFSKAPPETAIGSPVGVSDRVTYTVYGPSLIVKLGRGVGLQFDVEGALNTRNLAKGTVFRGGISFSR